MDIEKLCYYNTLIINGMLESVAAGFWATDDFFHLNWLHSFFSLVSA